MAPLERLIGSFPFYFLYIASQSSPKPSQALSKAAQRLSKASPKPPLTTPKLVLEPPWPPRDSPKPPQSSKLNIKVWFCGPFRHLYHQVAISFETSRLRKVSWRGCLERNDHFVTKVSEGVAELYLDFPLFCFSPISFWRVRKPRFHTQLKNKHFWAP